MELTNGKGVDVAIEATPGSFDICQSIVAAGGHIANIGVFGESVNLHMERGIRFNKKPWAGGYCGWICADVSGRPEWLGFS